MKGPSGNQLVNVRGIESPIAHETSIFDDGIDFSSSTFALSLSSQVYLLEMFIYEESIPPEKACLGIDYQ